MCGWGGEIDAKGQHRLTEGWRRDGKKSFENRWNGVVWGEWELYSLNNVILQFKENPLWGVLGQLFTDYLLKIIVAWLLCCPANFHTLSHWLNISMQINNIKVVLCCILVPDHQLAKPLAFLGGNYGSGTLGRRNCWGPRMLTLLKVSIFQQRVSCEGAMIWLSVGNWKGMFLVFCRYIPVFVFNNDGVILIAPQHTYSVSLCVA